jgi:hypothetical protein
MKRIDSTWWERCAALLAVGALGAALLSGSVSCNGEDLVFQGEFPTFTPRTTPTASPTPDDGSDEEEDDTDNPAA